MKTTEVNKELIGRRCECIFTGLMVTGVIEDTEENEHTIEVKVRFDHPHQWGDDLYNDVWAWGRKIDDFGAYSGGYPFSISGDIRSVPS